MIAAGYRFHGSAGFRRMYGIGVTVRGGMLSLKVARRQGQRARVAIVVSRKVSKSAVVRGRIRRRMYEIFRTRCDLESLPYDVICIVYDPGLATIDHPQLLRQVDKLLQGARVALDRQRRNSTGTIRNHGIVNRKKASS